MRAVHIMSGDLILHKRTLEPIKTLLYGLRRYDIDRCAALIDTADPVNMNVKVVGYMSHKSRIYLVGPDFAQAPHSTTQQFHSSFLVPGRCF